MIQAIAYPSKLTTYSVPDWRLDCVALVGPTIDLMLDSAALSDARHTCRVINSLSALLLPILFLGPSVLWSSIPAFSWLNGMSICLVALGGLFIWGIVGLLVWPMIMAISYHILLQWLSDKAVGYTQAERGTALDSWFRVPINSS